MQGATDGTVHAALYATGNLKGEDDPFPEQAGYRALPFGSTGSAPLSDAAQRYSPHPDSPILLLEA